ncbi:MAG: hypothetical protein K8F25_03620 [Fimbriimonadaceae bacterium]|nr:hypothetical protein [Alphaproteobacteria bacterium]
MSTLLKSAIKQYKDGLMIVQLCSRDDTPPTPHKTLVSLVKEFVRGLEEAAAEQALLEANNTTLWERIINLRGLVSELRGENRAVKQPPAPGDDGYEDYEEDFADRDPYKHTPERTADPEAPGARTMRIIKGLCDTSRRAETLLRKANDEVLAREDEIAELKNKLEDRGRDLTKAVETAYNYGAKDWVEWAHPNIFARLSGRPYQSDDAG